MTNSSVASLNLCRCTKHYSYFAHTNSAQTQTHSHPITIQHLKIRCDNLPATILQTYLHTALEKRAKRLGCMGVSPRYVAIHTNMKWFRWHCLIGVLYAKRSFCYGWQPAVAFTYRIALANVHWVKRRTCTSRCILVPAALREHFADGLRACACARLCLCVWTYAFFWHSTTHSLWMRLQNTVWNSIHGAFNNKYPFASALQTICMVDGTVHAMNACAHAWVLFEVYTIVFVVSCHTIIVITFCNKTWKCSYYMNDDDRKLRLHTHRS